MERKQSAIVAVRQSTACQALPAPSGVIVETSDGQLSSERPGTGRCG